MQILRVFNNNVVLARSGEHGGEVVATGRGIGFGKKQGDVLDPAAVTRVFVPAEGRDPDHSAQMLAGLPASSASPRLPWPSRPSVHQRTAATG